MLTQQQVLRAAPGALLLFEGVFMLRPELRDFWDVSVYLHADPEVSIDRARVRDLQVFGSVDMIEERYRQRYLPGQELYRADASPIDEADIVLGMDDPAWPAVMRWLSRP